MSYCSAALSNKFTSDTELWKPSIEFYH